VQDLADPTTATLAIAEAFARAGLDAAVYGGLALAAYGEPRETRDADFVASIEPETAIAALTAAGMEAVLAFASVRFGGNDVTRLTLLGALDGSGLNVLDLVAPRSASYRTRLLERALEGRIQGRTIRIVSPEDFVIVKVLSTRERDLEDAASVLRELGRRLDLALVEREIAFLADELTDFDVHARWSRLR
jgi:hypothetical protein